jgi:hypothetical protein
LLQEGRTPGRYKLKELTAAKELLHFPTAVRTLSQKLRGVQSLFARSSISQVNQNLISSSTLDFAQSNL